LFSGEEVLSTVQYGQILQKDEANIYINGVKVATEENFLQHHLVDQSDEEGAEPRAIERRTDGVFLSRETNLAREQGVEHDASPRRFFEPVYGRGPPDRIDLERRGDSFI